jgi:two-component system chemotaxis response regulator CheB
VRGAAGAAAPDDRPAAPAPARALDVVLAEDSLATREVLRVLLEEQGFRVRLAADGEEALERIAERVPDVLVSDVNMPRKDGLALARAVRGRRETARLPDRAPHVAGRRAHPRGRRGGGRGRVPHQVPLQRRSARRDARAPRRSPRMTPARDREETAGAAPERASLAIVVDDYALAAAPGLDAELARAGALVMRSFRSVPGPHLLRHHRGAALVGGADRTALLARLERATTTVSAPVIAILPRGLAPGPEFRGPGVVDVVPAGTRDLARRVLLMAEVPVVSAGRAAPPSARGARPKPAAPGEGPRVPAAAGGSLDVVAVASSTGGVWVLSEMLRALRPAGRAVVVAQHMDADFVPFFAEWLQGVSGWPTTLVTEGVRCVAGVVYVPAGGRDLVMEGAAVRAVKASGHFVPSGDRLLASAAGHGPRATGVVLSGMGSDGAEGLGAIVRAGGRGICQAPGTAVVPSMPESALRRAPGALPVAPDGIAAAIERDTDP